MLAKPTSSFIWCPSIYIVKTQCDRVEVWFNGVELTCLMKFPIISKSSPSYSFRMFITLIFLSLVLFISSSCRTITLNIRHYIKFYLIPLFYRQLEMFFIQQVIGVFIVYFHEGNWYITLFKFVILLKFVLFSSSSNKNVRARGIIPLIYQVSAPDIVKVFPDPDWP